MPKANRMSVCRDCEEKMRETNYVTEVGKFSAGGWCQLCQRYHPELKLVEFENREDADRRRHKQKLEQAPQKDTRARYREPWRTT